MEPGQRVVCLEELEAVLRRAVGNTTGGKWLVLSYVSQESYSLRQPGPLAHLIAMRSYAMWYQFVTVYNPWCLLGHCEGVLPVVCPHCLHTAFVAYGAQALSNYLITAI